MRCNMASLVRPKDSSACPLSSCGMRDLGLSRWPSGRQPLANVGDAGSIPGSWLSRGEGHGSPLQYPCLENPMERGSLASYGLQGPEESDMTEATEHACMGDLSSWTRDRACVPCIGRQIHNRWATRQVSWDILIFLTCPQSSQNCIHWCSLNDKLFIAAELWALKSHFFPWLEVCSVTA